MQGIKTFIETKKKANYINKLLQVGFDTIDFGSFVSPKAIPQMRDTAAVLSQLDLDATDSKLLAIVANTRGAVNACAFEEIRYLGYPFSISETFQLRNTNATIEESIGRVERIHNLCVKHNKEMVVYISMGFGNPYGDEWNVEIVSKWTERLSQMGIKILSLSDTIGVSNPESISYLFSNLIPAYPTIEFGAHLHTTPDTWHEKVDAAYQNGCRRFDSAMRGFGGCPMAKDKLTGNMATENMLYFFEKNKIEHGLDTGLFAEAMDMVNDVFPEH
jgi:hydroxymethylglutaryl-CoA lyase